MGRPVARGAIGRAVQSLLLGERTGKGQGGAGEGRPVADARGSAGRRAGVYVNLTTQRNRETRYRIDTETLANARGALKAAEEGRRARHGLCCVHFRSPVALARRPRRGARKIAGLALEIGERIGDPFRVAMCLCYLTLTAARRHDVEAVQSLAPQALAAAEAVNYRAYVASAKATMAWACGSGRTSKTPLRWPQRRWNCGPAWLSRSRSSGLACGRSSRCASPPGRWTRLLKPAVSCSSPLSYDFRTTSRRCWRRQ